MRRADRHLLVLLSLMLLLVSCSRNGLSVNELQVQSYVYQNGDMGLSVYFQAECKDPSSLGMTVTSPSSDLSWTLNANKVSFSNVDYYGSSDIAMPSGMALEQGTWTVNIIYKDGSVVSREFVVSYGDVRKALESYSASVHEGTWFDADTNLTVLAF